MFHHFPLAEIRARQAGQRRDNSLKDRRKDSVRSRSPELQKHTSWATEPLQLGSQGLPQFLGFLTLCSRPAELSVTPSAPHTPAELLTKSQYCSLRS